jgi:hypothetical protein
MYEMCTCAHVDIHGDNEIFITLLCIMLLVYVCVIVSRDIISTNGCHETFMMNYFLITSTIIIKCQLHVNEFHYSWHFVILLKCSMEKNQ